MGDAPLTGKLTYELNGTRLEITATSCEPSRIHEAMVGALGELTKPTFVLFEPLPTELNPRLTGRRWFL